MGDTLDLVGIAECDREVLRSLATRLRRVSERPRKPPLSAKQAELPSRSKLSVGLKTLNDEFHSLNDTSRTRALTAAESARLELLVRRGYPSEPRGEA